MAYSLRTVTPPSKPLQNLKHWQGYRVHNSQAKFKEEEGVQEFVHHASMMEHTGTDSFCV